MDCRASCRLHGGNSAGLETDISPSDDQATVPAGVAAADARVGVDPGLSVSLPCSSPHPADPAKRQSRPPSPAGAVRQPVSCLPRPYLTPFFFNLAPLSPLFFSLISSTHSATKSPTLSPCAIFSNLCPWYVLSVCKDPSSQLSPHHSYLIRRPWAYTTLLAFVSPLLFLLIPLDVPILLLVLYPPFHLQVTDHHQLADLTRLWTCRLTHEPDPLLESLPRPPPCCHIERTMASSKPLCPKPRTHQLTPVALAVGAGTVGRDGRQTHSMKSGDTLRGGWMPSAVRLTRIRTRPSLDGRTVYARANHHRNRQYCDPAAERYQWVACPPKLSTARSRAL